jgi:hypothetical protein
MAPKVAALLALTALLLFPPAAFAATPLPSGTEIHVNVSQHGLHFEPSAAVFPDGGFVVVWSTGPASGGRTVIHARLFAANGRPTSGEFRLTEPAAGSQFVDQVVADRDGSFLVAWSEERGPGGPTDVNVRRFGRDGTPGREILVNEDRSESRFRGRLAVGADGRFAVAWTAIQDSFENAMARVFHADGTPAGDEIVVAAGNAGDSGDNALFVSPTGVALEPDGSLSVLFESSSPALEFLAHYSVRGVETAHVPLTPDFSVINGAGSSLAMAPDGSLIAAWSMNHEATASRLTKRAVLRSGPFSLSKRRGVDQGMPA